jgi:hypothetical protein
MLVAGDIFEPVEKGDRERGSPVARLRVVMPQRSKVGDRYEQVPRSVLRGE